MSMIAFYTGASGMRAFQEKLNVTSHNIANINTNGYKARRTAFQDLLYSRMNTNVEGEHLVGHGVKVEGIDQMMGQSNLSMTDYQLDFAIVGDGFFQVEYQGEIEYTRNGAFNISMEGGTPTLVTNDGAYVLDRAGNRITLPMAQGSTNVPDTSGIKDRLGVYSFPNQWGLAARNNARFVETDNSGEAQLVQVGQLVNGQSVEVTQGYLEASNVDLGNEMIDVIMAQRAFQVSSRVLQTADQIAEQLNNLR